MNYAWVTGALSSASQFRLKAGTILRNTARQQQRRLLTGALATIFAVSGASAQQVWHISSATSAIAVGTPSPVQHVPLHVTSDISEIRILTAGSPNLEFTSAATSTCSFHMPVPADCFVDVIFTPTAPGRRTGAVVVLGTANQVLANQLLDGVASGPLSVVRSGRIDTLVGNGDSFYRADNVPATQAPIYIPKGVITDGEGNLILSDSGNNRIRRVGFVDQQISTIAGDGSPGASGDGGLALYARVSGPAGLAMDGAGNLYVADSGSHAVRRIDAATGIISTVAGTPQSPGYGGDGGLATQANLTAPNAIALDANGNLFIADRGNNVIRRVDAVTQIITTFAGTTQGYQGDGGLAIHAKLNTPLAVAFGPDGSLYIAELGNNVVRRVDTAGVITTVVGDGTGGFSGDGGPALSAQLAGPDAITIDSAGNLYIADSSNNRVRRVDALTSIITTICGVTSSLTTGDGYDANAAELAGPYALFLDPRANLFIADQFHNRIRRILSNTAVLFYPVQKEGKPSAAQGVVLENDGTSDLTAGNTLFSQSSLDPVTTTCTTPTLHSGENCLLGVVFNPTTTGNPVTGTLTYNSDGTNAPDIVNLNGQVLAVEPTGVGLAGNPNPGGVGQNITLVASVSSQDAARSGTVTFYEGSNLLGTSTLSSGTASLSISTLSLGQHTLVAKYSGDDNNAASQSDPLIEKIVQATRITLSSSLNPSTVTQTVTFTASLTATNTAISSGAINFFDAGTLLGIGNVDANGSASFSTSNLSAASHNIYATFAGDAVSSASQSLTLTQLVHHAPTSTLLSVNPGTVTLGDTISFTAVVSSTGGPVPTGTVTFRAGSLILGSGSLDGNGSVTVSSTALPAGSDQVSASYAGDSSDAGSASVSVSVTVNRINTVSTLVSSSNPANAGSPLPLTITIAPASVHPAVGSITGTVTLSDGATVLGTATVTNGVASYSAAGLTVGGHALAASYSGNTNYAPNISPAVLQQVQITQSSTALSLSASSTIAGKPLMLTASVTTSGVKATGRVSFKEGPTVLGTGFLNSQATTFITLTNLAVGNHTVVAIYEGDTNYISSTSPASTVTVNIATTTLTLVASSSQLTVGAPLTLSGVLSGNGVLPSSASINLLDNGNLTATLTTTASGAIFFTASSLSVGTHTFVASYGGDASNAPAQAQPQTVTVDRATSTTVLTSSQSENVVGTAILLHATVNSSAANLTGTVRFQDGNTLLGSAQVSATADASLSLSTLATGAHAITAIYSGDSDHTGSSSAPISQQVVQPTSLTLQSNSNPSIAGLPVTLTAQLATNGNASGASRLQPTGNIIVLDGTMVLMTVPASGTAALSFTTSSLAVGTHPLTVTYAGDANFEASASVAILQIVKSAETSAQLNVSSNLIAYNSNLSLTAVLKGTGSLITGAVVFLDGAAPIEQASLGSNGSTTITTNTLSPGIHALSATYAGDRNNGSSSSPVVVVQVKQTGQLVLASSSSPALTLDQVTLTASMMVGVAPVATGSVQFHEGTVLLGNAALDAKGVATIQVGTFAAGAHTLSASYTGDNSDYPADSVPLSLQVQLRPTKNALTATAPSAASGGVLSLISVLQWNGPVAPTGITTFRAGGIVIGTSRLDAAGVATLNIAAQTLPATVTASYSGDAAYAASDSAQVSFPNNDATSFTLTLDPGSISVQTSRYVEAKLTIRSLSGFSDSLSLGCLGLPLAATCTYDKDIVTLPADSTTTINVTIDTGSPLTGGGHASVQTSHRSNLSLCCLPTSALCAFFVLRIRRRTQLCTVALLLLLSVILLPISGCGSLTINSTPPGSYTFKVSAAGQKTGVTISQPVPMTVKP